METKAFFGWVMRTPLILLNLATLGVGVYAAMGKVPGFYISWGAPAIIGGLLVSYIIGCFMISSSKNEEPEYEKEADPVQEADPTQFR